MAKSTRTPDIDAYLRQHYSVKTTQELANELGRSRRTVASWLKELELTPKTAEPGASSRHIFTEEEISFLESNWFEPITMLAEKLGVHEITVKKHLRRLGIQRPVGKIENMRVRARIYRDRCNSTHPSEWLDLPYTRFDAKKAGSTRYWDGQPCEANGHISPRKTSSGGCWECERLASIEKYKNSPEERARQKAYNKIYNLKNNEKIRSARKNWYESGGREVIRNWTRNELNSNPSFKISKRLRDRLLKAIRYQSTRKHQSAITMLGCEIEDLIAFLEAQFTDSMTWDNYGSDTWHIDHVRPCQSFDLTSPKQQIVCFNWRNLQPLPRFENQSKLHTYDPDDEALWVERMRSLGFDGELFLKYGCSK